MAGDETREVRLRRLRLRSRSRGIREMDLILGGFADRDLAGLSPAELGAFDALLSEDDHEVYAWVAGVAAVPPGYTGIVARIRARHGLPEG